MLITTLAAELIVSVPAGGNMHGVAVGVFVGVGGVPKVKLPTCCPAELYSGRIALPDKNKELGGMQLMTDCS